MLNKNRLYLKLILKDLVVFQVFFFLMHELHEMAHIITGRVICGGWGTRDFNIWNLCETCTARHPQIAVIAGPCFTYLMIWLGWYMLKCGAEVKTRSLGLVFIFGNMPFGRMYMAATGSGDEITAIRSLYMNQAHTNLSTLRLINLFIICVICLPPLIAAYRSIQNKHRLLLFCGLLILPLVLDTLILLVGLNGLLGKGLLNWPWLMGEPLLVTIWFVICSLTVLLNIKMLYGFAAMVNCTNRSGREPANDCTGQGIKLTPGKPAA